MWHGLSLTYVPCAMSFHSVGATWHVIYNATWHGLNLAYVPRGMARFSLATNGIA
jgi:hypothetical protein